MKSSLSSLVESFYLSAYQNRFSVLATCCLVVALLAQFSPPLVQAAAPAKKPNIIVIMGDDVGYGDVSCNGATAITTPHIDALAEQGLRFTSGYCSASTCTPTRYSFLTGSYAFRKKGTGIAAPTAPATEPRPRRRDDDRFRRGDERRRSKTASAGQPDQNPRASLP